MAAIHFSGEPTKVITNSEIHKHTDAVFAEFDELSKKFGGFSFWGQCYKTFYGCNIQILLNA